MDTMSRSPVILVYSRSAKAFGDWLAAHDCPGTIHPASSPEDVAAVIGTAEVVLAASRFPVELFARAKRLQWVQSMGAGVDELVGAPLLPPEVVISRIVGQFGSYIAEYVFAELLATARSLERVRAAQRERRWDHFVAQTLQGQTLGVAGLGSIGKEIVRKGRALDMAVYGLSRSGTAAALVDRHFTPDRWIDFVGDLDVLVLALPRTAETEKVVDADVLGAMRPQAVLINVGRGILVDERALIQAIRGKQIAGAVLDVFETEPLPEDSPLWDLPGVRVSPHIAGPSTPEGVGSYFLSNVHRFILGEPLAGFVDRSLGY
jgi:glyoxylate/hydroxypyruvate reductase A